MSDGFGMLKRDPATESAVQAGQESLNVAGQYVKDVLKNVEYTVQKKKDGGEVYQFNMDGQSARTIMDALKNMSAIQESYTNEIRSLQAREEQVRSHPLINVLTRVAGELAQDKRYPGWVGAMGRASMALNPTPEELMGKRVGLQQILAQSAGESGRLASELSAIQSRQTGEKMAAAREERLASGQKSRDLAAMQHDFAQEAKSGSFDADSAEKMMLASGADPEAARATTQHYADVAQAWDDHRNRLALLTDEKEKTKQKEEMNRQLAVEEKKHQYRLKELESREQEKSKHPAYKPLAEKAAQWENDAGERPDPRMPMDKAAEAGFHPVGKVSTADTYRASTKLIDQLFDLIPKLEEKGFLSSGTDIASTTLAGAKRKLRPGDPDLAAWSAHAGTMVSLLRQLGDIGPRAMPAFMSAIQIIEKPTSAAAARQAIENLRDAIKQAQAKRSTSQGSATDPLGIR